MKSIYGTRVTRLAATKRDRMITAVDLVVIEYGGIDCSVMRITAFRRGHLPILTLVDLLLIASALAVLNLYIWRPGLHAASSTVMQCRGWKNTRHYSFTLPWRWGVKKQESDRTHIKTHIIILSVIYTVTSARMNQICENQPDFEAGRWMPV